MITLHRFCLNRILSEPTIDLLHHFRWNITQSKYINKWFRSSCNNVVLYPLQISRTGVSQSDAVLNDTQNTYILGTLTVLPVIQPAYSKPHWQDWIFCYLLLHENELTININGFDSFVLILFCMWCGLSLGPRKDNSAQGIYIYWSNKIQRKVVAYLSVEYPVSIQSHNDRPSDLTILTLD